MKFQGGVSDLSSVVGGVMGAGVVPWQRIFAELLLFRNGGDVTLVAAGFTTIASGTFTRVFAVGDLVLAVAYCSALKGATAGRCRYRLRADGGTGTFLTGDTEIDVPVDDSSVVNGLNFKENMVGIFRCTVAGTCIIFVDGQSFQSDAVVGASNCEGTALALPSE